MQAVRGLVVAAEDTQTRDSSVSAWPDWRAAGRWEVSRHRQGQVWRVSRRTKASDLDPVGDGGKSGFS